MFISVYVSVTRSHYNSTIIRNPETSDTNFPKMSIYFVIASYGNVSVEFLTRFSTDKKINDIMYYIPPNSNINGTLTISGIEF